jgi:hypothetical protein
MTSRQNWTRSQNAGDALVRMDPETRTLPRWLARGKYPLQEGATLHPAARDTSGLVRGVDVYRRR